MRPRTLPNRLPTRTTSNCRAGPQPTFARSNLVLNDPSMFSKFFIERPIFANVIAIITVLIGVVALCGAADRAVPGDHAADHSGADRLSGGQRLHAGRNGRHADRAAGQRRRKHAVHAVDLFGRRFLHVDRHVRDRHQPRRRPGARAEPCGDCRADSCPKRSGGRASPSRSSRRTSFW